MRIGVKMALQLRENIRENYLKSRRNWFKMMGENLYVNSERIMAKRARGKS
jgi:hypothetical protein